MDLLLRMNDTSEPLLTLDQLRDAVEARLGPLADLDVDPSTAGDGSRASWTATTTGGSTVRGVVTVDTRWIDGALVLAPVIEVERISGFNFGEAES